MHETRATAILSAVSEQNYPRAIELLNLYADAYPQYPGFKPRARRFTEYGIDLVNGIKAKRSFVNIPSLPKAKTQEFQEKSNQHFEDLRATMKKIEQIEMQIRMDDVRSTVWVVKAVVHCTVAVLVVAFVIEVSRGVLPSANIVLDDTFTKMTDWVFNKVGM